MEQAKGSKAKTELLKKYVVDEDFQWMAKNALSQGYSFGVDSLPDYEPYEEAPDSLIVDYVEILKKQSGVTEANLDNLYKLMCSSEECYNVILRILRKDLRCGVAAKTINKVSPGLIFRSGYQRCAGAEHAHKITYEPFAILERKANGMFSYLLPSGRFMTRKGEVGDIPGNQVSRVVHSIPELRDKILGLELVVLEEDGLTVMNRAKGNGLLNSYFKGGDPGVADRVRAYVWLCLTPEEFQMGKGELPYHKMRENLHKWVPLLNSPILPIDSWLVSSFEQAMKKTKELIRLGEEGCVLKSMSDDFFWADEDPSYFQVKLKAEAEAEFVIIDAYEGDPNKKYAGMLGGITVRSKDGVIVSDCGGGFSDAQRKEGVEFWKSKAGNIVTIKFNGITEPNDEGIRALDHPRLVEERFDKEEADTYEYCRDLLLGVIEK